MHFCRSCFSTMVFFRYFLFFLNLFCPCFMCNKYYSMLSNFRRYIFSVSAICFIDQKHTQQNLDTKVKYFMKVFYVSWNVPETAFHEMLWKRSVTVHPCLKKRCPENMQQIYRRTRTPKHDLKSHFGMGVLQQICCIFSEHLSLGTPLGGCFSKFKRYGRRIT